MSTAKEIVIVEHSEEHSLNASKEAGSNGSGDPTGTPTAGAERSGISRRRYSLLRLKESVETSPSR